MNGDYDSVSKLDASNCRGVRGGECACSLVKIEIFRKSEIIVIIWR